MQKKILFILGTRPEAIKLIPLFLEFRKKNNCKVKFVLLLNIEKC